MTQFQRFWHWWVGQVSDALPKLSSVRKRAAIAALARDAALLLRLRDEPETMLGELQHDMPEHLRQTLLSRIDLEVAGNKRVVLWIPEDAALQRQVELPIAAEDHLTSIAANELERWTPWRPDQAVFSVQVLERVQAAGMLVVELTAVPRFVFSQAAELLKENGLTLIGVLRERQGQAGQFIEVESESRSSSAGFRRWKIAGLAATCGIIALLALAFAQKLFAIHSLKERLIEIAEDVEATQKLVAETKTLAYRARYADEIKQTRASPIVVLNTLSQILPDDCWLQALSLEGDKLTVQGHAKDALSLLPLLNSSGRFRDVKFDSEVVSDPDAGSETFNLSATALPYAAK
jgi:general secretion pathway protein L